MALALKAQVTFGGTVGSVGSVGSVGPVSSVGFVGFVGYVGSGSSDGSGSGSSSKHQKFLCGLYSYFFLALKAKKCGSGFESSGKLWWHCWPYCLCRIALALEAQESTRSSYGKVFLCL